MHSVVISHIVSSLMAFREKTAISSKEDKTMTHDEYVNAAEFWNNREYKEMPVDELKTIVDDFLSSSSVCVLATGYDEFVRCTPLEYSYHDGRLWIFTEGGEKFIGLEHNKNVSLAIFEKNPSFNELKSIQIMGKAEIIEPMSELYIAHALYKKIPAAALQKLLDQGRPMHLICITPTKLDILFSEFKKKGYDSRQKLYF